MTQTRSVAALSRRALLQRSLAAGIAGATPAIGRESRSVAAQASPVAQAGAAELFAALDDFVTMRMAELQVPGVAIGVIVGQQEHAAGFGVTNVDHPLPVDADTLFQIGSTGKTFTATALMRLVEQGKLDLDAPVRDYLPGFRVADEDVSREVLLRHLVTHTAGWFGDDLTDTGDGDDALEKYVEGMADLPQIAPLGEYFSYNNAAVALAGRVIEVVRDQPYEAAIAELVFQPLGLEQSFLFPKAVMTRAFAVGHEPPPDDPQGAPRVAEPWALPRSMHPAGGVISSVSDQLRYARFHLGDGTVDGTPVLTPESMRRMQTPLGPGGSLGGLVLDGVGVNWLLTTIEGEAPPSGGGGPGGERVVMHGGSTNGQQSLLLLVPSRDFAITVLTNAEAGALLAEEATMWALEQFLGLHLPALTPIEAAPEQLAEYTGDYDFGEGLTITISLDGGELSLVTTQNGEAFPGGSGPLPLVAADRGLFDFDGAPFLTDFVRDDAGEVGWIRFSGRLAPRTG